MKLTYLARMAVPLLGIAFGFFIGCTALKSTESTNDDDKSLRERLELVESRIDQDRGNAEAYYQKGDILHSLAQRTTPPAERTDYYRRMRTSLDEATKIYRGAGNTHGRETVNELLKVSWSFEHNQGVELLQTETDLTRNTLSTAADHFQNAIVILPDSTVSYRMKARALYRGDRLDDAVATLEELSQRIGDLPGALKEQLAFLYLESDRPQAAVTLYEEAESFSEANLNLLHGLANAYIASDKHREAIALLETLVENEPANIIYLESYGTELYRLGNHYYDSLATADRSDTTALMATKSRADSLMNLAETQFQRTLQENSESTELMDKLASFYKNYAVNLQQVRPLLPEASRTEADEQINLMLNSALNLYETLIEETPEETTYWNQLYQIYSALGMSDQATNAKAKANL